MTDEEREAKIRAAFAEVKDFERNDSPYWPPSAIGFLLDLIDTARAEIVRLTARASESEGT